MKKNIKVNFLPSELNRLVLACKHEANNLFKRSRNYPIDSFEHSYWNQAAHETCELYMKLKKIRMNNLNRKEKKIIKEIGRTRWYRLCMTD